MRIRHEKRVKNPESRGCQEKKGWEKRKEWEYNKKQEIRKTTNHGLPQTLD